MALIRVAEIGEMTCEMDVVNNQVLSVVINAPRKLQPVILIMSDAGAVATKMVLASNRTSLTYILPQPRPVQTIVADAAVHGGKVVGQQFLKLQPFMFVEHD